MKKKNILMISIDCLRPDKIFGTKRKSITPNFDKLIKIGTFFPNTIASSSVTTPNAVSLLTGFYPFVHGVKDITGYCLNPQIKTIAGVLKENNYNTYASVSGPLRVEHKIDRGFDEFDSHYRYINLHTHFKHFKDIVSKLKEPWFFWLHFFDIHEPRYINEHYKNKKYGESGYEQAVSSFDYLLGKFLDNIDFENTVIIITSDHGEHIDEFRLVPLTKLFIIPFPKRFINLYNKLKYYIYKKSNIIEKIFRTWFFLDHSVKYISFFDNPSLIKRDRTLIIRKLAKLIFRKTNPNIFNHQPKLCGKIYPNLRYRYIFVRSHGLHLFDFLIRVPLILIGKNIFPKGKIIYNQVRQIDIFPTIIDSLNIKLKNLVQGKSLIPLIKGKPFPDLNAYIEVPGFTPLIGIRTNEWKYIHTPEYNELKGELYNLKKDPEEIHNLISKFPKIAEKLNVKLLEIQKEKFEHISLKIYKMTHEEEERVKQSLKELGYID